MPSSRARVPLRTVLVGVLAALVVLAVLGAVVGVERVAAELAGADPRIAGGAFVAAAAWLGAWGLSLWVALRTLGVPIGRRRALAVYASAVFLNGLTPFAQVGGEALTAALLTRSTDADYETGLAAVTAVDVVNLVPSPLFAVAGVASLVVAGAHTPAARLAAATLLGVSTLTAVAAAVAWRSRAAVGERLVRAAVGCVAAANRLTGRLLPVDPTRLAARVESFFGGVERVVSDRRCLATCLSLSVVGWTALVAAFWLSLRAVGHPVSAGLAAVVLPVGMLAVAVPLPGGVGGVEAALVGLLVGVGGVPVAGATAGVVVYRGATYWVPMAVGGVVTAALTAERRTRSG